MALDEPDGLTVVAAEPAPRTFAALEYNLRRHGVRHRAFQVAVGEAAGRCAFGGVWWCDGRLAVVVVVLLIGPTRSCTYGHRATLHFYPHMPGNSTLDAARAARPRAELNVRLRAHLEAGREEVEVEVTTLPMLLQRAGVTGVDLLKIDVEGLEEAVLRGMDAGAWAGVRQVVAEVHDRDGARARVDALLRGPGGFARVVWERPEWAEAGMDNVMVYATR